MGTYELYLVRHGLAEERGEAWPDDTKRPLTAQGMSRLRKETRGLAAMGVSLDIVLTSPLVRARQTAEILAAGVESRPDIVNVDSLAPGGSVQALTGDLKKHSRHRRIALVGHEPSLGEIAARLIGAREPLAFKKGAVCRIDFEALPPEEPGALRWFLPPKILRQLRS